MKILITGGSGFVGAALVTYLARLEKYDVNYTFRNKSLELSSEVKSYKIEDISDKTNWIDSLVGVDTVVHCAARVHIMTDTSERPLEEFRKVNVLGTKKLLEQAIESGAQRFIYLSSIKVNGEKTSENKPFISGEDVGPEDDYAISKYEGEAEVTRLAEEAKIDFVILRLPLVYGPGVKANFKKLIKISKSSIPLPFKSLRGKRSMVSLNNLVDLIEVCIQKRGHIGDTFLVSDDDDKTVPEIVQIIQKVYNRPTLLFSFPEHFLRLLARIAGRENQLNRLTEFLQVDITRTKKELNWKPIMSFEQSIEKMKNGNG